MALIKKENLTEQEQKFCELYVKYGNGYKAFMEAYSGYENWKRSSIDNKVCRLVKNDRISQRIAEIREIKNNAIAKSTKLSHKKLLNEAIELFAKCKENPAQYANAINVLKMLFNKEGLNNEGQAVQVNINNAPVINEITNYLDI